MVQSGDCEVSMSGKESNTVKVWVAVLLIVLFLSVLYKIRTNEDRICAIESKVGIESGYCRK